MSLVLTEEQELLRDSARDFVADHCSVDELRRVRDDRAHDPGLWPQMVELGWAGIPFPEACGGAELGFAELGVVLEELGRRLVATPFLSSVVLGGGAVQLAGSEAQQRELLTPLAEGRTRLALAYQETPRHDPWAIETSARADGDGYLLSGRKTLVLDAAAADTLVVAARTSGSSGEREGLTLFALDAGTAGVAVKPTFLIDSRSAANVELDRARVDASAVLGEIDGAAEPLETVFDRAAVALSAEMLGGIQESFDRTVGYLKEREQFGVPIGSFQGLKHRAARWFCEVELTRSIVMDALRAIDEGRPERAELASTCKARASDTFRRCGEEGIQMYGGIGVTDEEDIGFFLKRARVCEILLGDAAYHRNRFAELRGY